MLIYWAVRCEINGWKPLFNLSPTSSSSCDPPRRRRPNRLALPSPEPPPVQFFLRRSPTTGMMITVNLHYRNPKNIILWEWSRAEKKWVWSQTKFWFCERLHLCCAYKIIFQNNFVIEINCDVIDYTGKIWPKLRRKNVEKLLFHLYCISYFFYFLPAQVLFLVLIV